MTRGRGMNGYRALISAVAVLLLVMPVLSVCITDAESPSSIPVSGTEYTITFDTNSGGKAQLDVTTMTTVDQKLNDLPIPIWKDHQFDGWYIELTKASEKVTASKVYSQDTTLVAHWTGPEDRYNTGGSIDFTDTNTVVMIAFVIAALCICVFAALIAMNRRRYR